MDEKHELLSGLREEIHGLLRSFEGNKDVLDDSNELVHRVCQNIENCMMHGLAKVAKGKDTVSLFGLLYWTNTTQQQQHKQWVSDKEKALDQSNTASWYEDLFADELNQLDQITTRTLSLRSDNQNNETLAKESPATPGFQASVRAVNSLTNVTTPEGKVRAWIRQCLNTHILSKALESVMSEHNTQLLTSYFSPQALMVDPDMREIFIGLTSALDRFSFGFRIDDVALDSGRVKEKQIVAEEPQVSSPEKPMVEPSVRHVLSEKTLELYDRLKSTSPAILCPRVLNDTANQPFKEKTFGVPLEKLLHNVKTCQLAYLDPYLGVPNLVEGSLRLIDASVTTSGLFATKLEPKRLKELSVLVRKLGCLSIWNSPHHATTILIQFLSELPEPILDSRFLIADAEKQNELQLVQHLRQLVNELPWYVQPLLIRIMGTLSRALQYSGQNGLRIEKLARLFAPVWFGRANCTSQNAKDLIYICMTLISRNGQVFQDVRLHLNNARMALEEKIQRVDRIPNALSRSIDATRDQELIAKLKLRLEQAKAVGFVEGEGIVDLLDLEEVWTYFGFRTANPLDELNHGGILTLEALLYFLHEHEEIARQILHLRRQQCRSNYPFPPTCVYLLRMVCALLSALDPLSTEEQYNVELFPDRWLSGCDESNPSTKSTVSVGISGRICSSPLWRLFDDPFTLEKLFGMAVLLFDRNWTRSGATCMDFNTILAETRCQLQLLLKEKPNTVNELWEIWLGESSRQKQQIQEGNLPKPVAMAHMKRYKVIVPAGVAIRATPSVQSKKIGTRELHDVIETVLKVSDFVKLREVPGVADSGWIQIPGNLTLL